MTDFFERLLLVAVVVEIGGFGGGPLGAGRNIRLPDFLSEPPRDLTVVSSLAPLPGPGRDDSEASELVLPAFLVIMLADRPRSLIFTSPKTLMRIFSGFISLCMI